MDCIRTQRLRVCVPASRPHRRRRKNRCLRNCRSGGGGFTRAVAQKRPQVTVITASDIRKYGYRTLVSLAAAGVYVTYDRIYHYVASRFSIRRLQHALLVMLNGTAHRQYLQFEWLLR